MKVPTVASCSKEQVQQLERILELSKDVVTVMAVEDYARLTAVAGKEEIQLHLPARDIFSEEIRVLIHNSTFNHNI